MSNSFLQSAEWEEFQHSVGRKTFRVDGVLLIKRPLGFGRSYFYIPRIDIRYLILDINNFLHKIEVLAQKEKVIFLRWEPVEQYPISNIPALPAGRQYPIYKVADVQPSKTILLDLKKTAEELLTDMHSKTRYNIRLAEKKGVTVREAGVTEFETFWELMKETTGRDGFRAHDKEYYKKMLSLTPSPLSQRARGYDELQIKLFFTAYEGKILAAGIFVFYGDTMTYLHGASTPEHKEVMAPYALHWQMIKFAKQQEYARYDFYGIDEKKWPGVTRFKKGFGGEEVKYPGCYDIVFSKGWYKVYKLSRGLKRIF